MELQHVVIKTVLLREVQANFFNSYYILIFSKFRPHNTILLTSIQFLYIFPVFQRNKKSQFITKCKQTCGRERKDSPPFVRKCKPRFVVTPPNNTKQAVL